MKTRSTIQAVFGQAVFGLFLFALPVFAAEFSTEQVSVESRDENATAFVHAMPAYYDFGSVKSSASRMTTITFMNSSAESIPYFTAYCMGDLSVFSCSSSCFQLQPYGSCSVMVTFSPRNGDGFMKSVTVQGSGGSTFASSQVFGTDTK